MGPLVALVPSAMPALVAHSVVELAVLSVRALRVEPSAAGQHSVLQPRAVRLAAGAPLEQRSQLPSLHSVREPLAHQPLPLAVSLERRPRPRREALVAAHSAVEVLLERNSSSKAELAILRSSHLR